jgi:hypothetical protein
MHDVETYPRILKISSDDWGWSQPPETADDLARVSRSLKGLTDCRGNPPRFTAYFVAGGPDFDRIVQSQFRQYSWRFCYEDRTEMVQAWRDAISEGVWDLQFHAMDHANTPLLMDLLQKDAFRFRHAFREHRVPVCQDNPEEWARMMELDPRLRYFGCPFLDAKVHPPRVLPYGLQLDHVRQGKAEIERRFGVRLRVGTAPSHQWDTRTWKAFQEARLDYIDTCPRRIESAGYGSSLRKTWHQVGYGTRYRNIKAIIRNVDYEPVWFKTYAWAHRMDGLNALDRCRELLSKRAPVVISTHRLNYVALPEEQKNAHCSELRSMLEILLTEFKDLTFLSALEFGDCMYADGHTTQTKISVRKVWQRRSRLIRLCRRVHGSLHSRAK